MFGKKTIKWYKVFDSAETAKALVTVNKTIAIEAGEKRLCLLRTNEGFYAFDEKCPHQGLPLTRGGFCEDGKIVCPFHRYAWDLRTGRETRGQEPNIRLYQVRQDEHGLHVGIDEKKSWLF